MASFDPSVISQIPDYAGNPIEARAKGYKLADLITEQQRNKLLLAGQQEQLDEQQKARGILTNFKGDIGTPEGNIELARQYQKAGLTKPAMESLQFGSEQQTRDLQQKELRLRALDLSANIIGPAALQVKQVLGSQGLPAAQALYRQLKATIPQEFQQNLPPELPNNPQQAGAMLDQATAISSRARQMLDEQRKDRETAVKEKGETEREKHDRAMEAASLRRQEGEGQKVETIVDPKSRIPRRVLFDAKGNPVKDLGEAPAGRGEHPTEAENKAAVNYTTMKNAEDVLESPKYKDMNMAFLSTVEEDEHGYLHALGRLGRKRALTADEQVVAQAARQFAEGAGHLKSGARINQATMQLMVDLYLPLPGDAPELKARKRAARRNDLVAGRVGAGRAAENIDKAEKTESAKRGDDTAGTGGWKIEPVK